MGRFMSATGQFFIGHLRAVFTSAHGQFPMAVDTRARDLGRNSCGIATSPRKLLPFQDIGLRQGPQALSEFEVHPAMLPFQP